jgi:glycosyltransferase involved in cell wall biosynthesis
MGWGGQEMRVLAEAAGMAGRGHEVRVACQPGSVIAERARGFGINTCVMGMNGPFDIPAVRRLTNLLRTEEFDILNTHSSKDSWCAGLASRLCDGVKTIRTRHLFIPIGDGRDSRFLYRTIPDAVVTMGEAIRRHIMDQAGVPSDRIVSIPTGIDLEQFDPGRTSGQEIRAELGIPQDSILIGTIGMMREMKGHVYFLRAAAHIARTCPDARFLMVGDSPECTNNQTRDKILAELAGMSIRDRVITPGFRTDVADLLAAMDVFVLASVRDEGLPQVITQAMAMRRPVVATNVGGVPEQVIDGETGYLVPPENAGQLADAVIRVLTDPSKAREMCSQGRRMVECKFTLEAMLDATEELYTRLHS